MKDLFSMKDQAVLITGASDGIGRHFALRLAETGAKVIVAARRLEKLNEVVNAIQAHGGRVAAITLDVASKESIEQAIPKAIEAFGHIDVLINNAGVMVSKSSCWEYQNSDWDKVMDVNLKSVWSISMLVAKHMKENKIAGRIINMSSVASSFVRANNTLYTVSKAALNQLTRSLAFDLLKDNIRVNAIAPSLIATEMGTQLIQKVGAQILERVPMKRLAEYDELMGPLLLLASQASSFMTGVVIGVDGGMSCNPM